LKREITFEFNSAVLTAVGKRYVTRLVALLRRYPKTKVHAKGFTAGKPGKDHQHSPKLANARGKMVGGNMLNLSSWRAHAVVNLFLSQGISQNLLSASGHGTDASGARVELECSPSGVDVKRDGNGKAWESGCRCICHPPEVARLQAPPAPAAREIEKSKSCVIS